MTRAEILERYPNASAAFIARNADDTPSEIPAHHPQPDQRRALECSKPGEAASWYGNRSRFEITFVVYSTRPCDWDGWDIKASQDVLVLAGILPGDDWKTLAGRVRSEKVYTTEEERTEIEIAAFP